MHDVIVVGAGPAGNLAAHRLAALGHRVVVVDSRTAIGDKLCTGVVGLECVRRFPPREEHVLGSARSARVVSPAGKTYLVSKAQPQAYVIDRVAFVASLAEQAQAAGADYVLGERATDVRIDKDGVVVTTTGGSGARRYDGRMVALASGFGSGLVRTMGFRGKGRQGFMVGCQAEVQAEGLTETEVYLGDAVAPGSFGWLVPISPTRALAGLISSRRLNGHMDGLLTSLREAGKIGSITRPARRWGVPLKPLSRTYADRVLVLGDAAGLAKPTTGGGIYYALISGELAAEAMDDALAAGDLSARRLRRYEERWQTTFGRELWVGYQARRIYERLADDQIERLLAEFLAPQAQHELLESREFSFDWHSALIVKALGHKVFGRLIWACAPAVGPLLSRLGALATR